MKNIMLDLETLGTTADSVIVSIGAVYFDETGLGTEIYIPINIESSLTAGRKVTAGTLRFWFAQSKEAQDSTFASNDIAPSLASALESFRKFVFLAGDTKVTVWGMGSDFDCAMLADTYTAMGMTLPWKYSSARCFRTLRALYPEVAPDEARAGVYHNSLADAKTQALHAVKILQHMAEQKDDAWKYKDLSK